MDQEVSDDLEASDADNAVHRATVNPAEPSDVALRFNVDAANRFLESLWLDIEEERVRGREMGREAVRTLRAELGNLSLPSAESRVQPALIDAPEAARLLGITEPALRQRVSRRQIRCVVRTGRRVQFHLPTLLAGLERKAVRP